MIPSHTYNTVTIIFDNSTEQQCCTSFARERVHYFSFSFKFDLKVQNTADTCALDIERQFYLASRVRIRHNGECNRAIWNWPDHIGVTALYTRRAKATRSREPADSWWNIAALPLADWKWPGSTYAQCCARSRRNLGITRDPAYRSKNGSWWISVHQLLPLAATKSWLFETVAIQRKIFVALVQIQDDQFETAWYREVPLQNRPRMQMYDHR